MENKKIMMIKHAPMNLKYTNKFYTNQFSKDVNLEEVMFIDVTSRNRDFNFIKDISPFYLGPVMSSDGVTFKIFENFWQSSKVFNGQTKFKRKLSKRKEEEYEFNSSNNDGSPSDEWFKVREFLSNEDLAYRRPFEGDLSYYYLKENNEVKRLSYLEARKKIFFPTYARCVVKTEGYKYLKSLVDQGKTIALLDFDAYNYDNEDYMRVRYERDLKKNPDLKYTLDDYLKIKSMKDVVNFEGLLAGQAFILKMLLEGDIEVINDEVIDHIGAFL